MEFNDRRASAAPKTFKVNYSDKPVTYKGRCGTCFAPDGQPCTTRAGKKTTRMHNGRSIGPAK